VPSLSSLGEFGFLKKLLPQLYWPKKNKRRLRVGPGDDAGVLALSSGHVLVATTDALVEGRHFERPWFPWKDLGYKSLAVNLSDLAAMGAVRPVAALVTAAFPKDTRMEEVDSFYRGLEECAQEWQTGLLGGDTVGSKEGWMISITVLGEALPQQIVRRSGARVGDYVVTSGALGLAAAGLEVLQQKKRALPWTSPLVSAFSRPQPRFMEGALLGKNQWVTSLMDCSDGLEASARLLSEASGVGMELQLKELPISKALTRWAEHTQKPSWTYALQGGEDYELIFTVPAALWNRAHKKLPKAKIIGHVRPRAEKVTAITPEGKKLALEGYGFAHFKK